MGSVSLKAGEGTAKFRKSTLCSSALNLIMLFSVLTTNLFALYAFKYSGLKPHHSNHSLKNMSLISEHVGLILREINFSQKKLAKMEKDLLGYDTIGIPKTNLASELKLFLQEQSLPLGKDSKSGLKEMVSSVGHTCLKSRDLLADYMNYKVDDVCPDDWSLGQKLILRGCEPLPRRRCFTKSVHKFGIFSFPSSMWKQVSDKIVTWSGLVCRSFKCLNSKKIAGNCNGCFDLVNGTERNRFVRARGKNDFLINDVLGLVGNGGVRLGFDIGGGSGSFAARMAEKDVTVITSTLNVDVPFNDFIAARGLFPLYSSLDQRFPFYDNVFDLIHAANGFGDGGKVEKLDFLMFDLDRILRPGGLFWLDNFYCVDEQRKINLTKLIERFGYKKLKWVIGERSDSSGRYQVYLSAILQKPVYEELWQFTTGVWSKTKHFDEAKWWHMHKQV